MWPHGREKNKLPFYYDPSTDNMDVSSTQKNLKKWSRGYNIKCAINPNIVANKNGIDTFCLD